MLAKSETSKWDHDFVMVAKPIWFPLMLQMLQDFPTWANKQYKVIDFVIEQMSVTTTITKDKVASCSIIK